MQPPRTWESVAMEVLRIEPPLDLLAEEPEPQLSENARRVLEKRYLRKDETGKVIETPKELFWRVAWNLAQADRLYGSTEEQVLASARTFYRLIARLEFLPNSPTLMNAGLDLQQLSACFVLPVEDSLAGIFQTLKESALIHQSGGGCVAGDSHVLTTFCGVERIETLYERIRALDVAEEVRPGHRVMDISGLGVRTFAVDPAAGAFDTKQVTHLWRWEIPGDRQYRICCSDGTEVTTSEWHPFLVLTEDGVRERRADALRPGDVLLGPNRSVRDVWPFTHYLEQEGFVLDERMAWLIGFFLGDGSLDWFHNRKTRYRALRLRLFDGRPENIRFARDVLAAHGISVTPQQDRRGLWSLTTVNAGFVPRIARLAQTGPGPKEALTMPEWVAKSPLTVIAAFLGGLIDSDGYVSLNRRRLEFSTVCLELASRLVSLLSALGFNPSIRAKAPGPRAKLVEYRVHMADAKRTPELVSMVRAWVHDPFRGHRLDLLTERVAHNTHARIPLPFALLEKLLIAAGVSTRSTAIHRSAVAVGEARLWLHRAKWGDGIGEDKLRRLVRALRPVISNEYRPLLDQLEHLAGGWSSVESVDKVAEPKTFYDLTVADSNNYLAGGGLGKMAVVHNTGYSFSRLRPKNDFVRSTMGVASGPVSFMKVYDAATQQVKQGSKRRGANMGILRVDHPDILEFITCKDDIREITNFNVSVAATDAFMEAVAKGGKYDLVSPRTGKVVQQFDAREVFEKIAYQAWKNGEPGLFFIDETNRRQPTPHLGLMEATNPCVAGDTMVSTAEGLVPIRDLAERGLTDLVVDARASSAASGLMQFGTMRAKALRVWKTGVRPVSRLVTHSGFSITATEDHRFLTPQGWTRLDALPVGQKVYLQSGEGGFAADPSLPFVPEQEVRGANGRTYWFRFPTLWSHDLGFVLGWLIGDGWLRAGDKNCRVGFTFASEDTTAMCRVEEFMAGVLGKRLRPVRRANSVYHLSFHSKYVVDFFRRLGVGSWQSHEKRAPRTIFRAPRDAVAGFLRGLFGADGTENFIRGSNAYVRLTSTSRELLNDVQLLLLNFGVRSTIYRRTKSSPRVFHYVTVAGEARAYGSQHELFELSVSRDNVLRVLEILGDSISPEMQTLLGSQRYTSERFEDEVVAIEAAGEEEVYDLEEPSTHSFVGNGYITHNCGEQPLLPYESCNLGSIDLEKHTVRGKDGKWEVDWVHLERSIRASVRLLDNVIDMNSYPVKQIEEMTKATRKIGLGVMGFARMLFMLEARYDSAEGVEWGRKVMAFIKSVGYDESQKLARERGPYPAWDGSLHQKMGLVMRNSYVTTVAPTGTISMIADTSGGCEPEFSLIWYKRVMDGEQLPYFLEYFEEVAKREGFWSEDLVAKVLENKGRARGLKEVPPKWQKVFAVSFDVSPEWHVRMQAAFQDSSDSACSKTINLPTEATVEDVKKAYLLAYELKCKGITVYRDQSRTDQVLNVGVAGPKAAAAKIEMPAAAAIVKPRPRPDVITGRTQKILTGYGALYVTVNEDDTGLFEVFAQIGRGGGYTASFTEGLARLVSLCLRSGVPVDAIIDQLEGIRSPRIALNHGERVFSIPDAIALALKRHIGAAKPGVVPPVESFDELGGPIATDDELEKEARDTEALVKRGLNPECPECGHELLMEEGCAKCRNCGYTEC